MASNPNTYVSDHSDSVLKSHSQRTAANSAAYLLPYIQSRMQILDVGCGPGSITMDFAALVPNGRVIGVDDGSDVIGKARSLASERGTKNVSFEVGDAHALPFPDDTFDVVHGHQVLQHIADPVQALVEWRRVVKKDGIVACRESDVGSATYYPDISGLDTFHHVYRKTARSLGGEPDGGRHLVSWALQSGISR